MQKNPDMNLLCNTDQFPLTNTEQGFLFFSLPPPTPLQKKKIREVAEQEEGKKKKGDFSSGVSFAGPFFSFPEKQRRRRRWEIASERNASLL